MVRKTISEQNALPLKWHDSYDIEHYIIAKCNELAWQAIQQPTEWAMPVLLVTGEAVSGKTHLAEIFATLHDAVKITDLETVKQALESDHPRIFDNIDCFLRDYPQAAEDVFHLVNASITDKIPLLLTARNLPKEWAVLPDLLSRLQAANHIRLQEPNDEMIKNSYHKLFSDRGILVDHRVLEYLAARSERSFAGIRRNVELLDKAALEQSRKITIPLIKDIKLFD